MPEYVRGAFISMEDERFYKHHGFDIKGTVRALFSTIGERMCKVEAQLRSKQSKTIITIMNARLHVKLKNCLLLIKLKNNIVRIKY